MRVVVSCSGKFHAFSLVEQLEKRGIDVVFYTTYSSIRNPILKFFVKRTDKESINPRSIKTNFFIAVVHKLTQRKPQFANDLFDYWVSRKIRKIDANVFIGWSGMSLISLKTAKKMGWKTILERGSTHIQFQNEILIKEYLLRGLDFSIAPATIEKEKSEYEICDVISIPSNFVKNSFINLGVIEHKLFINPYGSNNFFLRTAPKKDNIFRVLYVGRISIQKGFYYLAEAMRDLLDYNIEFWLIGSVDDDISAEFELVRKLLNVRYLGHIDHYDLVNYIQNCDVGVQPSLQEGLSMVIPQMMKVGLPVIATPNTGADELIINDYNGVIIPVRSSVAIVEAILKLFLDSAKLKLLTHNVSKTNMEDNSWDAYGHRYSNMLRTLEILMY